MRRFLKVLATWTTCYDLSWQMADLLTSTAND